MMGASLVFKMDHVNWSRVTESDIDPYFTQYTIDAINHNELHQSLKKLNIMRGLEADSAFFNSVIIPNVDGRDLDSINLATKIARVRSNQVIDFVQITIPGFENARVIDIANTVGVRETVHLEAMYRLTE